MMRALLIGLGVSGAGAALLLKRLGYELVVIEESGDPHKQRLIDQFEMWSIPAHSPLPPLDLMVLSPGIPADHPRVQEGIAQGVELVGEVELAARHLRQWPQPTIGVTGTNGKSTLTKALEHLVRKSGRPARALGNIGNSLSAYVAAPPVAQELLIVELSSFQLETVQTPFLDLGLVSSLSVDHLDRYGSMESYLASKRKILNCLKPGAPLLLSPQVMASGYGRLFDQEGAERDSCLQLSSKGEYLWRLDRESLRCWGTELERVWGADLLTLLDRAGSYLGLTREGMVDAMGSFRALPHRLEYVGEVGGMGCYNDSKATNVAATLFAVSQLPGPILLLAGGRYKGGDFREWIVPCRKKRVHLFAFGEARVRMNEELGDAIPVSLCKSMQEAFALARSRRLQGGSLLLSPGCASFDQFAGYRERGEAFNKMVNRGRESRCAEKI